MWEVMKSSPTLPGFDEVRLPGERTAQLYQERMAHGVPLGAELCRFWMSSRIAWVFSDCSRSRWHLTLLREAEPVMLAMTAERNWTSSLPLRNAR